MRWLIIAVIIFAQQPAKAPEVKGNTDSEVAQVSKQSDRRNSNEQPAQPEPSPSADSQLFSAELKPRLGKASDDADIQGKLVTFTELLVVVGFLQFFALVGQVVIYCRQAKIMGHQAHEMTRQRVTMRHQLETMKGQLQQMEDSGTQTTELIKHAAGQVDALGTAAQAAKETAEAARISAIAGENSALAASANASALVNSERAWIMAELNWYEKGLHVVENTSQVRDGTRVESTMVNVKLICRNEGRSPAWIDNVSGRVDINTRISDSYEEPSRDSLDSFGLMEPLGPGAKESRSLQFECSGHAKEAEFLSVYVLVEYHDIFGVKRTTHLGYSIDPVGKNMNRQNAIRKRNRNT
jgi:hypothetical protein